MLDDLQISDLLEFITANDVDFFVVTESWFSLNDPATLIESAPPDHVFLSPGRRWSRRGKQEAIFLSTTSQHLRALVLF